MLAVQRLRPPQRAATTAVSFDRAGRGAQSSDDWGSAPLTPGAFAYGLRPGSSSLAGAESTPLRGGATYAAGRSSAASGGEFI